MFRSLSGKEASSDSQLIQPKSPPPYSIVSPEQNDGILLSTLGEIPGYEVIKFHGIVYGTTVRSGGYNMEKSDERKDSLYGGEAYRLTSLVQAAREQATDRMIEGVKASGANAAVGLRFDSESMGRVSDASQVCCCATAVSVVPRGIGKSIP